MGCSLAPPWCISQAITSSPGSPNKGEESPTPKPSVGGIVVEGGRETSGQRVKPSQERQTKQAKEQQKAELEGGREVPQGKRRKMFPCEPMQGWRRGAKSGTPPPREASGASGAATAPLRTLGQQMEFPLKRTLLELLQGNVLPQKRRGQLIVFVDILMGEKRTSAVVLYGGEKSP